MEGGSKTQRLIDTLLDLMYYYEWPFSNMTPSLMDSRTLASSLLHTSVPSSFSSSSSKAVILTFPHHFHIITFHLLNPDPPQPPLPLPPWLSPLHHEVYKENILSVRVFFIIIGTSNNNRKERNIIGKDVK